MMPNACDNPDCANERDVHKGLLAEVLELRRSIVLLDGSYRAAMKRAEDWQKLANIRAAEIIRLDAELDALRTELAKREQA